jgi:hypothetical protein
MIVEGSTRSTWLVRAICTAPGEFPSRSIEQTKVQTVTIEGAIRLATRYFNASWLDPIVVEAVRVTPKIAV